MGTLHEQFPYRIHLPTSIQNCLVEGITFALFKSTTKQVASQALESISARASYDLQPTILLATNALKHILVKENDV